MPGRIIRILLAAACLVLFMAPTSPAGADDDPGQSLQWGLAKVRAAEVWGRATGAGTSIAIVDTGIDLNHVEFAGRILPGADFTESDGYQDDCGHGTHVAGIAAAAAGNGQGGAGVAPGANIIPVKVLAPDGDTCSGTRAGEGIRWAADQGATVINVSLGGDVQFLLGPSFKDDVRYAWNKGSVVVASAGNTGFFGSGFSREPLLVVAATDMADRRASYSSDTGSAQWGIAAPGGNAGRDEAKDIFSSYWKEGEPNAYAYAAGTSQAAPFVAGAAAILRSLGMTKEQTVEILRTTAVRGDCGPAQCGAGRLDVAAAVEKVPFTAPPPGALPSVPTVAGPAKTKTTTRRPATSSSGTRRPSTAGEAEAPRDDGTSGPVVPDSVLENDQAALNPDGTVGIDTESDDQRPWSMVAFASSLLAIAGAWAAVRTRREYAQ